MAFQSSPVVYPPSSSPPHTLASRKRANEDPAPPAKKRLFNKTLGGSASVASTSTSAVTGNQKATVPVSVNPSRNPFAEDEPETEDPETTVNDETSLGCPSTQNVPQSTGYRICVSSTGRQKFISQKQDQNSIAYEKLIAQRSTTDVGKATRSYYGIDIHQILEDAKDANESKEVQMLVEADSLSEEVLPTVEIADSNKKQKYPLWTEKYRAKKFTDLVGDERTHRSVLRWLKHWDSIVFPGSGKPRLKQGIYEDKEETTHRKILMLTGPPGLGKTTLAHVCARQAGYEVVEINASDERSRDVVRGKIKDCVGTENVRGINTQIGDSTVRKAGRPVCVVVDEVDGVVSGSGGGGEGGFVKALIDLVLLDQKNASFTTRQTNATGKRKRGDKFKLLRPMILICNDVYHPSLRPLRASGLAEIVHVRKPPLEKIVTRMKHVFEKESIPADLDAVRRLCEATWGIASRKDRSTSSANGEGDIRGILVIGQWVASRLKGSHSGLDIPRLTRQWLEQNILADLANGGSGARSVGRGGVKETVDRIFLEGGGFPKSTKKSAEDEIPSLANEASQAPKSVTETAKGQAMNLLRTAIEQCGEHDRIVSDLFTTYPTCSFQDDTFLSKPTMAYEWLHFHDSISSRVFSQQDWELGPYLSQTALSFHHLFASAKHTHWTAKEVDKEEETVLPFSGPKADFDYHEAQKANIASLQALHSSLSLPLYRSFHSPQDLAIDLVPHLHRLLAPDVKPVMIGGSGEQRSTATVRRESERDKVCRAAEAMAATGISFEKTRVEDENARGGYGGYVFRMEPPVDTLASFATANKVGVVASSRYAVRQVLDQELIIHRAKAVAASRLARSGLPAETLKAAASDVENVTAAVQQQPRTITKRDFFGRVIVNEERLDTNGDVLPPSAKEKMAAGVASGDKGRVWVTFHEGFSNAVRKPIGIRELLEGL